MKTFRLSTFTLMFAGILFLVPACKKDKSPSDLGGDTQIPLTEIGSKTTVYVELGDLELPGEIEVINRDGDGIVTYKATIDYSGFPQAGLIDDLVNDEYQDGPGKIKANFQMKITSEGYMDYFLQGGVPWIVVRYDDPVGTKYKATQSDGTVLTRTITEKTGVDDFPFSFWYIKTIKVEQEMAADDPIAKKLIYRANHKFGLVYVELELLNGEKLKLSLFPWHVM
jgi:hypothetical protein